MLLRFLDFAEIVRPMQNSVVLCLGEHDVADWEVVQALMVNLEPAEP